MAMAATSMPMSVLCSSRAGWKTRKDSNSSNTSSKNQQRQIRVLGNFRHFGEVVGKDVEFLRTRISRGIEWANEALSVPQLSKTLDDFIWLRNLEDPSTPSFEFPSWPNPRYPELTGVDLFVADLKALEAYISYFYHLSKLWTKPLPEVYDPQEVADYFNCRPHVVALRLLEVFASFTAAAIKIRTSAIRNLYSSSVDNDNEQSISQYNYGMVLKETMLNLGPTFIKVGQSLSTRPDIIGSEITKALSELHDQIPPFPRTVAMKIIEEELGSPVETFFSYLSPEPVAAASFGQVYRGSTVDGLSVAVKVQRPNMRHVVVRDIYILRLGLGLFQRIAKRKSDLRLYADELGKGFVGELDYTLEAANALEFMDAHSRFPFISVPKVFRHLSRKRVLTMEWMVGESPSDLIYVSGKDSVDHGSTYLERQQSDARRRLLDLVNKGVQATLVQLLETGVLHADPHPGNLRYTSSGHIGFLDFGLLCRMEKKHQFAMLASIVHIVNGDWASLVHALTEMDVVSPGTNIRRVTMDLEDSLGEVEFKDGMPDVKFSRDTIGNGKAGTKVQCLTSAAAALKDGKSVFIDRCNLDREQRADFVKLGGSHGAVHAVVLDLPAKLCISRSVKRTGHEGNLQGGKAAAVVNRMLQKKELPKLSEGFSRITFCQNESDVQAAVNAYGALSPLDSLPSGCFGQKNPDAKVQLGIMKFLKKVDAPNSAANVSQGSASNQLLKENNIASDGPENGSASSGNVSMEVKVGKDLDMVSLDGTVSLDEVPTLAFPSISTADFQFNLEKASDIIVEQVEVFVKKNGNARLVLVDLSHKSKILSLVSTKASRMNIDSSKFRTFVGDITRLYSQGGLRCNVIANAANWRLKPGGGGVNAAIYSAAGQALDTATKEQAGSLMPGKALVVPLPSTSPLFSREGITHVIHVLGPNMNPMRPNCLDNDYNKGCKVLREAYSSLFEGFASIIRMQEKLTKESSDRVGSETKDHFELSPLNQFPITDQKVKREGVYESEGNKKCKGSKNELESNSSNFMDINEDQSNEKSGESMSKAWGPWAQALYNIAMHPGKHKNDVIEISDDFLVLNDQYPKAQKHLLVLARAAGLDRLADVRTEHLQLLKTMHNVGLKWAEKFLTENESLVFRIGYHSVPSMRQLHLHVISQDFDSKHLKNKKHWHSFNSPFFRDSVDVIEEVGKHGKATLKDDERYLSMELRCHRCRSAHPNIPRLKSHVSYCQSPFPAVLLQNGRLVLPPNKIGTS